MAIATVGVIWSVLFFYVVWRWEDRQAEGHLEQVADTHFLVLQAGLDSYLSKLTSLRAFFEASDYVSRREFERFAARLLDRDTVTRNFSWVPRIGRDERAAWELAAHQDGITDYHIKAVLPDGEIVRAPARDEYFPIYYSSVGDRESPIYGIDLLSQAQIKPRIERARDTNAISTVPDFPLHSRQGQLSGILLSLPVYRRGALIDTVAERRKAIVGFVHGAFITSEAIEQAVGAGSDTVDLNTFLYASDAKPEDRPLYAHTARGRSSRLAPLSLREAKKGLHASGTLRAGAEEWQLIAIPVPGGRVDVRHDRAWLVLLCNLLVAFFATVYERRMVRANRRISDLAERDPLTHLANRRAFTSRLAEAFAESRHSGRHFTLLYFDLDEFKDINDTRGHPTGDKLLQEVAARVSNILRQSDVFARFGGDEFAILQTDASEPDAVSLAARINESLAAPYLIDGNLMRVTASIGIAVCKADSESPEALLVQADLALYRAKHDGRNCFRTHSADLDRIVGERVILSDELRTAVEKDELRLWYQPQVDLQTGRMIGAEALVRWQHPTRGFIPPSDFVHIAELTGQIDKIGIWVFDEACRQTRLWRDAGVAPGPIAVNVSGGHMKSNPDLHQVFAGLLKKHGLPPSAIQIELTESVMIEASKQHNDILNSLHQIGLQISLDDFGTGYSSLNYLTRFPISRLKIAQELVVGIVNDTRNAAIVRAIIHLAKELNIECLAEGVETARHRDLLANNQCRCGQGYYFSRPLSPHSMTILLQQKASALPLKRQFGIAS